MMNKQFTTKGSTPVSLSKSFGEETMTIEEAKKATIDARNQLREANYLNGKTVESEVNAVYEPKTKTGKKIGCVAKGVPANYRHF